MYSPQKSKEKVRTVKGVTRCQIEGLRRRAHCVHRMAGGELVEDAAIEGGHLHASVRTRRQQR